MQHHVRSMATWLTLGVLLLSDPALSPVPSTDSPDDRAQVRHSHETLAILVCPSRVHPPGYRKQAERSATTGDLVLVWTGVAGESPIEAGGETRPAPTAAPPVAPAPGHGLHLRV
jgi:hypothetical protein